MALGKIENNSENYTYKQNTPSNRQPTEKVENLMPAFVLMNK